MLSSFRIFRIFVNLNRKNEYDSLQILIESLKNLVNPILSFAIIYVKKKISLILSLSFFKKAVFFYIFSVLGCKFFAGKILIDPNERISFDTFLDSFSVVLQIISNENTEHVIKLYSLIYF